MKIFLKLKRWQLLLVYLLSTIIYTETRNTSYWILTLLFTDLIIFGWIYSIGKITNKINKNNKITNYHEDLWFAFSILYIILFEYFTFINTTRNILIQFMLFVFVIYSLSAYRDWEKIGRAHV